MNSMKLIIICGGPSFERDISLNSARSVYDNIKKRDGLDIELIFIDKLQQKHIISSDFLYSNTVSDFDFKLAQNGQPLKEEEFITELRSANLVFPVLHGEYGEDGQIQQLLEKLSVPFVASGSQACAKMYNKERADYEILKKNGFYTIPKLYIDQADDDASTKLKRFFKQFSLTEAIMKPIRGGSSIGVLYVDSVETAVKKIQQHLKDFGTLLIEPICEGREFTIIILQNPDGQPVALMPTEIEFIKDDDRIFSKRRKYLATSETHYYCPTRFGDAINQKIRAAAQELFHLSDAKDFLRIDGWLLDSGEIYFSDFNPISGMEQNSFIFQQAARVGLSHQQLLEYILNSAANRQSQKMPPVKSDTTIKKKEINIIMGGWTSEKQVSLMSGTNVWLKLLNSKKYTPTPYLLLDEQTIYEIPYAVALNHTVEEMRHQLENQVEFDVRSIRQSLGLDMDDCCTINAKPPMTIDEFIAGSKYVFIGLHGGFGENGELQEMLERAGVPHNGSDAKASEICMDKYRTGELVMALKIPKLRTCAKKLVNIDNLPKITGQMVAKPNDDGCSTGVVIIDSDEHLRQYVEYLKKGGVIPAHTFLNQSEKITISRRGNFLLEEFIKTDDIIIKNKLHYKPDTGWIELTVGVTEKNGRYRSFMPSITIAEAGVLSLEEKFQGGMGINITPPPEEIVPADLTKQIMDFMEKVAEKVGVRGYCRIDIFANNQTGEVIVIEVNTLPGLSPSTVLFQQAATFNQTPIDFLESIID